MKCKKILILLISSLLLTGCDFLQDVVEGLGNISINVNRPSSEESGVQTSEPSWENSEKSESINSSNSSVSQGSSSSSESSSNSSLDSSESSSEIVDTFDYYDKDAYKEIEFKSPDFTTRRIASIDDVTFDDLFNLGNKITIDVDVKDDQLKLLQKDYETGYKSEIYRIADKVEITLENYGNTYTWTFDQVGIRQKGNTSRQDIYQNGEIVNLNHFKLSFDETFDDVNMYGSSALDWSNDEEGRIAREDREFLGLSGLDIKWNKNYDATHIKEIYASYLYDAAGLMTSSIGLSVLNINQVDKNKTYNFGLCTLFEPVSKSFIKRELKKGPYINTSIWSEEKDGTYGVPDEKYGDYYKASYGVGDGNYGNGADLSSSSVNNKRVGIGNISGSYIPAYERKTNTDVEYDDSLMRTLARTITTSSYEDIDKVIDLKVFAITEACNFLIGNPDDLRNNNNNYTIYFRRTDGKAMILPIDNDRCFGITKDWNPDGHGMTEMSMFTTRGAAKESVNQLHKKTILASSSNDSKAIYLTYCKALKVSSWAKEETFNSFYNMAYSTYGNSSCRTSFGGGFDFTLNGANDNWAFKDYMNKKLQLIDLNQTISNPNSSNTGSSNKPSSSESNSSNNDQGNYGQVYLIGSFSSWSQGNKDYPLEYKGNGVYTITFTASNVSNRQLSWKVYDGNNFDTIDWTVEGDYLVLQGGGKSSAKINDVRNGDTITITLNTLDLTYEVKKG